MLLQNKQQTHAAIYYLQLHFSIVLYRGITTVAGDVCIL